MIRIFRLLAAYTTRAFLQWTAFRSFLFTLVFNQAVSPLIGLALWSAVLPGETQLSTYFIALLAVQLMTVSQEYYSVTLRIYEGGLNDDLLRPHAFVIGPLGESIAIRFWHLLGGLPILLIITMAAHVTFQTTDILLAMPALALAAALRFLFVFIMAITALWTQQAGGITSFGSTLIFLLGGIAVPIPLLPEQLRHVGEALPFRAMLGFPAEIASGSLNVLQVRAGYMWQVLWLIVCVAIGASMWQAGVRRYTAIGG